MMTSRKFLGKRAGKRLDLLVKSILARLEKKESSTRQTGVFDPTGWRNISLRLENLGLDRLKT
jgi:hypothetical protein